MNDKELITRLYILLEDAMSDPDFFYLSDEIIQELKDELDERGIPNTLDRHFSIRP